MTARELYSDHLETLVALVQHLAMTERKSKRPSALANALSLDPEEVKLVLENFKGLFRKSRTTSDETQEHFFTLQLRYARRWLGEHKEEDAELDEAEDACQSSHVNVPAFRGNDVPVIRGNDAPPCERMQNVKAPFQNVMLKNSISSFAPPRADLSGPGRDNLGHE